MCSFESVYLRLDFMRLNSKVVDHALSCILLPGLRPVDGEIRCRCYCLKVLRECYRILF